MRLKGIIIASIAIVIFCIGFFSWRRRRAKRKLDKEQMDRKIREDALDRALSNRLHHSRSSEAQTPFEVRYSGERTGGKDVEMLRLTEQSESMTKEYLFRMENVIFLGEEHGHAAIFYQRDKAHTIYCEIFPNDGAAYIRACKTAGGQLVRGKKKAGLDTKGIKLCSGDFIEMKCGTFLVEFI